MGMLPPHIKAITFEDPVEIEMPWPWLHQRTISRDLVGDDDRDFQSAVRTLFRSSLDVFSLGETRDGPTARVIRAVVESGHSCYTTTHARDAAGIITKYASPQIGIPIDVLGTPGMLRLNVYQSLLLKNCGCALSPDDLAQDLGPDERTKHLQLLEDIHNGYGVGPQQFKMRNPNGCDKCRKGDLSALWGFDGRTVVAEMMEPDETICEHIFKGDMVGLKRYWSGLSDGDVVSSDITGKSAMDIAMHKAVQGLIDPHEIELHFSSFRSLASKLDANKRLALRHLSNGRKLEAVT
jgi:type II secretory ATPase GspE/PulE/Tfp pilus assembly ATPase PilB-like protein